MAAEGTLVYNNTAYEQRATWPSMTGYVRITPVTVSPSPGKQRPIGRPYWEGLYETAAPFRFFTGRYEVPIGDDEGVCRVPNVPRLVNGKYTCYSGAPLTDEEKKRIEQIQAAAAEAQKKQEAQISENLAAMNKDNCGPKLFSESELKSRWPSNWAASTDWKKASSARWFYSCTTGKVSRQEVTTPIVIRGWDNAKPWLIGAVVVGGLFLALRAAR